MKKERKKEGKKGRKNNIVKGRKKEEGKEECTG